MTRLRALVPNPECRRIFWPWLTAIVEPGRRHVRVAEPFLHLGDGCFMGEGIGGGRGMHRMYAQPVNLDVQAHGLSIFPQNVAID